MNVRINSVHFKTDHKLDEFINQKVGKLSENYDAIIGSEVTLKVENAEDNVNKIAEIRLLVPGNDLFVKKQSKSFEESVDLGVEALKKQLVKYKQKQRGE